MNEDTVIRLWCKEFEEIQIVEAAIRATRSYVKRHCIPLKCPIPWRHWCNKCDDELALALHERDLRKAAT